MAIYFVAITDESQCISEKRLICMSRRGFNRMPFLSQSFIAALNPIHRFFANNYNNLLLTNIITIVLKCQDLRKKSFCNQSVFTFAKNWFISAISLKDYAIL